MKKIILIFIAILSLISNVGNAQNLIAVQNGGNPVFYTKLDSAITHAQNGDTIYIPGGNFTINKNIDKCLHIIGVGYNPDSTLATNPTNIFVTTSLFLITGASSGSLIGIRLSAELRFGTSSSNANVSNYTVGRCYICGRVMSYSSQATNNLFFENILAGAMTSGNTSISFYNAESNYFYNNIISGGNGSMETNTVLYIGSGSIFKNNIFINSSVNYYLSNVRNSTFENNIFADDALYNPLYGVDNNIFNNNIFVQNISFPYYTNTGSNNIVNQPQSSIWVNQSGNTFSYTQDYHLQPSCPGKNAGRDGTDIGIYGGVYPWKAASVPPNPHIQRFNISGSTNSNGALPVNIKVEAQDR